MATREAIWADSKTQFDVLHGSKWMTSPLRTQFPHILSWKKWYMENTRTRETAAKAVPFSLSPSSPRPLSFSQGSAALKFSSPPPPQSGPMAPPQHVSLLSRSTLVASSHRIKRCFQMYLTLGNVHNLQFFLVGSWCVDGVLWWDQHTQ